MHHAVSSISKFTTVWPHLTSQTKYLLCFSICYSLLVRHYTSLRKLNTSIHHFNCFSLTVISFIFWFSVRPSWSLRSSSLDTSIFLRLVVWLLTSQTSDSPAHTPVAAPLIHTTITLYYYLITFYYFTLNLILLISLLSSQTSLLRMSVEITGEKKIR